MPFVEQAGGCTLASTRYGCWGCGGAWRRGCTRRTRREARQRTRGGRQGWHRGPSNSSAHAPTHAPAAGTSSTGLTQRAPKGGEPFPYEWSSCFPRVPMLGEHMAPVFCLSPGLSGLPCNGRTRAPRLPKSGHPGLLSRHLYPVCAQSLKGLQFVYVLKVAGKVTCRL